MKKKVSIYSIAKRLNTSASTVSRALKDHPAISEETRLRVKKMAKEMNYQPNTLAVNLKRGKSNTIGVMVPFISRGFFSSAIEGIEDEADRVGYDVLICQSKESYEREKIILNSLSQGKVDGVIASIGAETTDYSHMKNLKNYDIPLILFDRVVDGVAEATVTADDYNGAYRMVKHLIGQGYKKIYHYGSYQHVSVWHRRYLGYMSALKDSGIVPEKDWFVIGNIRREDGVEYARKLMEAKELPDAVFCTSDYVALGAILEFERCGVRIPDDIAVAGYANESFGEVIKPSLTTVNQLSKEMGNQAARLLFAKLEGEIIEDIMIDPELIIRESSIKYE